jgi:Flp pilus assembly protein TadD
VPGHGSVRYEQEDAARLAEEATGRSLTPREVSGFWLRRAIDDIRAEPVAWLRLMGLKVILLVNRREAADTESSGEYSEYSAVLRGLRAIDFGAVGPLAAIGMWLSLHRWRELAILYWCVGAWAASTVAFFILSRYIFPMTPFILLFAGYAISALPRVQWSWRLGFSTAAITTTVLLVARIPVVSFANDAHYNVGSELLRLGRADDAAPLLERAVEIDPADAGARLNLGIAYATAGRPDRASQQFAATIQVRPDDAAAHEALGNALVAQGLLSDALDSLSRAVALEPGSWKFRTSLAVALWRSGQHESALNEYLEAVRLDPGNPVAHSNAGVALHQLGRPRDALSQYSAALALRPDYPEAHANAAQPLAELGDLRAAINHGRSAADLQPRNFAIRSNLADLLAQAGDREGALREYERLVQLAAPTVGDQLAAFARLADAQRRAGDHARARETLLVAADLATASGRPDAAKVFRQQASTIPRVK